VAKQLDSSIDIGARPERVWEVLTDPRSGRPPSNAPRAAPRVPGMTSGSAQR